MQQMQELAKVLTCSRRNQKPEKIETTGRPLTKKAQMDPWKDSGISDLSTDVSDYPAGKRFGKAVDSDTDGSSDAMAELSSNGAIIGGPPGLQPVAAQTPPWHRRNEPPEVQDGGNLNSLKEAVDRLTPAEIAAVRSLLDDKLNPTEQRSFKPRLSPLPPDPKGSQGALYNRSMHPLLTTSAPTRKPFTPWGGPATRQVKRVGEQRNASRYSEPSPYARAKEAGITVEVSPENSLATCLRDLMDVEDGRVVTVRKIGKLGFESRQKLEAYFQRFGTVEKTLVSHTKAKKERDRVRPAALGFVLMEKVEEVDAIFAHGEFHVVDGMEIQVCPFQSHSVNEKTAVAESL